MTPIVVRNFAFLLLHKVMSQVVDIVKVEEASV